MGETISVESMLAWAISFARSEDELREWASKECNLNAINMLDDESKNRIRAAWAMRRNELREACNEERPIPKRI